MTPDEFHQLMSQKTDRELLGPCLRDAIVPFVFEPSPPMWDRFRTDLSAELSVSKADITVVGSGRFGFSLRPWNNFKAYSDKSDIDVIVVDSDLFDQLWYGLLRAIYPRPPMTDKVGGWLQARRKEVYTGWLSPLEGRLDRSKCGSSRSTACASPRPTARWRLTRAPARGRTRR